MGFHRTFVGDGHMGDAITLRSQLLKSGFI